MYGGADRLLRADAADRRLAVRPARAQAADRRRLRRRRGRVRRLPAGRLVDRWLWVGIVLMGLFSFAESPQLQALLADIAPPSTRDASYALYFTMAFGVGSLWTARLRRDHRRGGRRDRPPDRLRLMAALVLRRRIATLPIAPSGRVDGGRGRRSLARSRPSAGRRRVAAIIRRLCETSTLGRGVAQLGSAHRSGR